MFKKKIYSSGILIIANLQIKLYKKQRRENIGVGKSFTFELASGFSL